MAAAASASMVVVAWEPWIGKSRLVIAPHGWEGPLSSSTQTAELAGLRRFYRWARAEGLRQDDPTEGIRPRLRALVLAFYLLTGRRRSEVLNLRWRDLDLSISASFPRKG